MKLDTACGNIIITEVFSGITLQTTEKNCMHICMRDDTFEFSIYPEGSKTYSTWRVDMQEQTIKKMNINKL
jgi:hypothetical protein